MISLQLFWLPWVIIRLLLRYFCFTTPVFLVLFEDLMLVSSGCQTVKKNINLTIWSWINPNYFSIWALLQKENVQFKNRVCAYILIICTLDLLFVWSKSRLVFITLSILNTCCSRQEQHYFKINFYDFQIWAGHRHPIGWNGKVGWNRC